jgi:hypothetical protein
VLVERLLDDCGGQHVVLPAAVAALLDVLGGAVVESILATVRRGAKLVFISARTAAVRSIGMPNSGPIIMALL